MEVIELYFDKILYTVIAFVLLIILRTNTIKVIKRVATKWERFPTRTALIKKFINYLYGFLLFIALFIIWGVQLQSLNVFLSSIFAVIGVAFFAQWSILSNITSGVIMFFTFPYKIGDFIKIHEGDDSIYGHIEDIRSFQVIIKSLDGEIITFPNSMMLQRGVSILDEANIKRIKKDLLQKKETSENDNIL